MKEFCLFPLIFGTVVGLFLPAASAVYEDVPQWVHDMRVRRVQELKRRIEESAKGRLLPSDTARDEVYIKEVLSQLGAEETRAQNYQRSFGLLGALVVMIVVALFFAVSGACVEEIYRAQSCRSKIASIFRLQFLERWVSAERMSQMARDLSSEEKNHPATAEHDIGRSAPGESQQSIPNSLRQAVPVRLIDLADTSWNNAARLHQRGSRAPFTTGNHLAKPGPLFKCHVMELQPDASSEKCDTSLLRNLRDLCRWSTNAQKNGVDAAGEEQRRGFSPVFRQGAHLISQHSRQQLGRSAKYKKPKSTSRSVHNQYSRRARCTDLPDLSPSCETRVSLPSVHSTDSSTNRKPTAKSAVVGLDADTRVAAALLTQPLAVKPTCNGSQEEDLCQPAPRRSARVIPLVCAVRPSYFFFGGLRPSSADELLRSCSTLAKQYKRSSVPATALRTEAEQRPVRYGKDGFVGRSPGMDGEACSPRHGEESTPTVSHIRRSALEHREWSPAVISYAVRKQCCKSTADCNTSAQPQLPETVRYLRNCRLRRGSAFQRYPTAVAPELENSSTSEGVEDSSQGSPYNCDCSSGHAAEDCAAVPPAGWPKEPLERHCGSRGANKRARTFSHRSTSRQTDSASSCPTAFNDLHDKPSAALSQKTMVARNTTRGFSSVLSCQAEYAGMTVLRTPRVRPVEAPDGGSNVPTDATHSEALNSGLVKTKKIYTRHAVAAGELEEEAVHFDPCTFNNLGEKDVTGFISDELCRAVDDFISSAKSRAPVEPADRRSLRYDKTAKRPTSSGSNTGRNSQAPLVLAPESNQVHANEFVAELGGKKCRGTSGDRSIEAVRKKEQHRGVQLCPVCPVLAWVAATAAAKCCYCGSVPSIPVIQGSSVETKKGASDIIMVPVGDSSLEVRPKTRSSLCSQAVTPSTAQSNTASGGRHTGEAEPEVGMLQRPQGLKYCQQSAQRIQEQLAHQQELLLKRIQKLGTTEGQAPAAEQLASSSELTEHLYIHAVGLETATSKGDESRRLGQCADRQSLHPAESPCQRVLVTDGHASGTTELETCTGAVYGRGYGGKEVDKPSGCLRVDAPKVAANLKTACCGDIQPGDISRYRRTEASAGAVQKTCCALNSPEQTSIEECATEGVEGRSRDMFDAKLAQCAPVSMSDAGVFRQGIDQKPKTATTDRNIATSPHTAVERGSRCSKTEVHSGPACRTIRACSTAPCSTAAGLGEFIDPNGRLSARDEQSKSQEMKMDLPLQDAFASASLSLRQDACDAGTTSSSPQAVDEVAGRSTSNVTSSAKSSLHCSSCVVATANACSAEDDKQAVRVPNRTAKACKIHNTANGTSTCACLRKNRKSRTPVKTQQKDFMGPGNVPSSTTSRPAGAKGDAENILRHKQDKVKNVLQAGSSIQYSKVGTAQRQARARPLNEATLMKDRSPSCIPTSSTMSAIRKNCSSRSDTSTECSLSDAPPSVEPCRTRTALVSSRKDSRIRQRTKTNAGSTESNGIVAETQSEKAIAAATAAAIAASVASAAAAVVRKSAETLAKRSTHVRYRNYCTPSNTSQRSFETFPSAAVTNDLSTAASPATAHSGPQEYASIIPSTAADSTFIRALGVTGQVSTPVSDTAAVGKQQYARTSPSSSAQKSSDGTASCGGRVVMNVTTTTGEKDSRKQGKVLGRPPLSCLSRSVTSSNSTSRSETSSAPERSLAISAVEERPASSHSNVAATPSARASAGVRADTRGRNPPAEMEGQHSAPLPQCSGLVKICGNHEQNDANSDNIALTSCRPQDLCAAASISRCEDSQTSLCDENSCSTAESLNGMTSKEQEVLQVEVQKSLEDVPEARAHRKRCGKGSCEGDETSDARRTSVQRGVSPVTAIGAAPASMQDPSHRGTLTVKPVSTPPPNGRPGSATDGHRRDHSPHPGQARSLRGQSCSLPGAFSRNETDHEAMRSEAGHRSKSQQKRIELASPRTLRDIAFLPLAGTSRSNNYASDVCNGNTSHGGSTSGKNHTCDSHPDICIRTHNEASVVCRSKVDSAHLTPKELPKQWTSLTSRSPGDCPEGEGGCYRTTRDPSESWRTHTIRYGRTNTRFPERELSNRNGNDLGIIKKEHEYQREAAPRSSIPLETGGGVPAFRERRFTFNIPPCGRDHVNNMHISIPVKTVLKCSSGNKAPTAAKKTECLDLPHDWHRHPSGGQFNPRDPPSSSTGTLWDCSVAPPGRADGLQSAGLVCRVLPAFSGDRPSILGSTAAPGKENTFGFASDIFLADAETTLTRPGSAMAERIRRGINISCSTRTKFGTAAAETCDAAEGVEKGRLVRCSPAVVSEKSSDATIGQERMHYARSPHFGLLPDCPESPFLSTSSEHTQSRFANSSVRIIPNTPRPRSVCPSSTGKEGTRFNEQLSSYTYIPEVPGSWVARNDVCPDMRQSTSYDEPTTDYFASPVRGRRDNGREFCRPPTPEELESGTNRATDEDGYLTTPQFHVEHGDVVAQASLRSPGGAAQSRRMTIAYQYDSPLPEGRTEAPPQLALLVDHCTTGATPLTDVDEEVPQETRDAALLKKPTRLSTREQILREFQEAQERMKGQEIQLQLLNERIKKQHSMLAACVPPSQTDCKQR